MTIMKLITVLLPFSRPLRHLPYYTKCCSVTHTAFCNARTSTTLDSMDAKTAYTGTIKGPWYPHCVSMNVFISILNKMDAREHFWKQKRSSLARTSTFRSYQRHAVNWTFTHAETWSFFSLSIWWFSFALFILFFGVSQNYFPSWPRNLPASENRSLHRSDDDRHFDLQTFYPSGKLPSKIICCIEIWSNNDLGSGSTSKFNYNARMLRRTFRAEMAHGMYSWGIFHKRTVLTS